MGFVVRRGENYSARLAIPKALRPTLGQNGFKKSLGTKSKKEAELLAAPLVLRWKKLIKEAKVDGATAKAKALRQAFASDKNHQSDAAGCCVFSERRDKLYSNQRDHSSLG